MPFIYISLDYSAVSMAGSRGKAGASFYVLVLKLASMMISNQVTHWAKYDLIGVALNTCLETYS